MKKIAVLALVAFAGAAQAQNWAEVGESGDLPGTANVTSGSGALLSITGVLDASDVDMFCISITDEAAFTATFDGSFDSQLWLFDSAGMGVTYNDDGPGGLNSFIDSTNVLSNGVYFLAISRYNRDAVSSGGLIWNNSPFTGQNAPTGPGAGSAVSGWTGTTSAGGSYLITLTGAGFHVPAPSALALLGLGGVVAGRRRR